MQAATAIKSYAPELIVLPALTRDAASFAKVEALVSRLDVVVVGPGLGRDAGVLEAASAIIGTFAVSSCLRIVL